MTTSGWVPSRTVVPEQGWLRIGEWLYSVVVCLQEDGGYYTTAGVLI